jgi:hypothetical protein
MATGKKPKPYKNRDMTKQVTTRFLAAAHEIIGLNKRNGGKYRSVKDFAKSVKSSSTMWSQYNDNEGRNVTVEMCAQLCKVHKVNGNWLMTGAGDKFGQSEGADQVVLEKRLQSLEDKLEKIVKAVSKK